MPRPIPELLRVIADLPGCEVIFLSEVPAIDEFEQREQIRLPVDLREFASIAAEVRLFTNCEFPLYIHGLSQLVRANPVIVGDPCMDDRSYHWFLIANDGNGDYLSIDLSWDRLGRCYDSFWDRHGVPGSCPVVALSFTDLLERALANHGQYWWWLQESFQSLGDAYDDPD